MSWPRVGSSARRVSDDTNLCSIHHRLAEQARAFISMLTDCLLFHLRDLPVPLAFTIISPGDAMTDVHLFSMIVHNVHGINAWMH